MEGFVFNDKNICTNPRLIGHKENYNKQFEVRTAQHNGKWGVAVACWCDIQGWSSPVSKEDCIHDSERTAILSGIGLLTKRLKKIMPGSKPLLTKLSELACNYRCPGLFD